MPIGIIAAVIGLVGSVAGGAFKSDQANKGAEAQRKAALEQSKLLRSQSLTDAMNYLSYSKNTEAQVIKWTLISAVVIVALLFWLAMKKNKK